MEVTEVTPLRYLKRCHNIADLREGARRYLPSPIFHFLDGAAEGELTARRNIEAFDERPLIPRCLRDVAAVSTATRILGLDIDLPVFCSPTGASRLFHPDGEIAVARAAAAAGTLYGLATGATHNIEDVAASSNGPKLFQLYVYKNRETTWGLIERCKRAGYAALCLTVDVPVIGKRERDLRSGFVMPPRLSRGSFLEFARRPAWLLGQARKGALSAANFSSDLEDNNFVKQSSRLAQQLDPSVTWKDVREIIDLWGGPFALKGVMSTEDARCAADMGVTAVIVSNHGGRQLDGAPASIEVLPEIVQAVGGRVEVILDGGIRRGVHILKALACGAKAVSIGRPYLYGLSVGGEAGVTKVLEILETELVRAMQLSGCADVNSVALSMFERYV